MLPHNRLSILNLFVIVTFDPDFSIKTFISLRDKRRTLTFQSCFHLYSPMINDAKYFFCISMSFVFHFIKSFLVCLMHCVKVKLFIFFMFSFLNTFCIF